jgi:type III restriction enzyme
MGSRSVLTSVWRGNSTRVLSKTEKKFARNLDVSREVSVYAKLPGGFFIPTPVGNYNPDWAIVFEEDKVKHVYFIAETKGSMDSLEFRGIEKAKIHCAKKHFEKISNNSVKYDAVDSFEKLLEIVR